MFLLPLAAMLAMQPGGDHGSTVPELPRSNLLAEPQGPWSGPSTPGFFSWAQVVRVSPRPAFGSGVIMVMTDFDVRVPGGETHNMTMVYGGEDQFIPPEGSICQIGFREGGIRASFGLEFPNAVDWMVCDTGRSLAGEATGNTKQPRPLR
jgi:hypothetical protein